MSLKEISWRVQANDLFDRESPRQINAEGVGLAAGLFELRHCVLAQGVRDSGQRTFTDFRLSWADGFIEVGTQPFDNHALVRMRGWIYGTPGPFESGSTVMQDATLLHAIAEAHVRLLAHASTHYEFGYEPNSPAGQIRACAMASRSGAEFITKLAHLGA